MNEIAQAAKLGSGTLYQHFAHKGELCEALVMGKNVAFWERIDAVLAHSREPALNRLSWLIDEFLQLLQTHVPLLAAAQRPRDSSTYYQNPLYGIVHARLSAQLSKAVEQGEAMDLNIAFTADAIFAAMTPSLFMFQCTARHFSLEQISAGMHHLFVDGLRVPAVEQ